MAEKRTGINPVETEYFSWLANNGVDYSLVRVTHFEDAGRGLVAETDIKKGACVLRIPHKLLMTCKTAMKSPLAAVLREQTVLPEIREDDLLALHLLYERQNKESKWYHHLQMQPTTYTNTQYFSGKEMDHLRGSNLFQYTTKVKEQMIGDFSGLTSIPNLTTCFPDGITYADYRWALGTIWSRGFDLKVHGGRVRSLCPLGDMWNHDPSKSSVHHSFSEDSYALEYVATRDIVKGEQIFIHYGPFPNLKLLRLYGFVLEDNEFDVVELWAAMDPATPLFDAKIRLLSQIGVQNDKPFELKGTGGMPSKLLTALRIQRMNDEDLPRAQEILDGALVNMENELLVLHSLLHGLKSMLSQYTTTVEEDAPLRDAAEPWSNTRNAIVHRMGEKRVLAYNIAQIETVLLALQGQTAE